jgi:hypothetical protein
VKIARTIVPRVTCLKCAIWYSKGILGDTFKQTLDVVAAFPDTSMSISWIDLLLALQVLAKRNDNRSFETGNALCGWTFKSLASGAIVCGVITWKTFRSVEFIRTFSTCLAFRGPGRSYSAKRARQAKCGKAAREFAR